MNGVPPGPKTDRDLLRGVGSGVWHYPGQAACGTSWPGCLRQETVLVQLNVMVIFGLVRGVGCLRHMAPLHTVATLCGQVCSVYSWS